MFGAKYVIDVLHRDGFAKYHAYFTQITLMCCHHADVKTWHHVPFIDKIFTALNVLRGEKWFWTQKLDMWS